MDGPGFAFGYGGRTAGLHGVFNFNKHLGAEGFVYPVCVFGASHVVSALWAFKAFEPLNGVGNEMFAVDTSGDHEWEAIGVWRWGRSGDSLNDCIVLVVYAAPLHGWTPLGETNAVLHVASFRDAHMLLWQDDNRCIVSLWRGLVEA